MSAPVPTCTHSRPQRGEVVRCPRASDAIGTSLRATFEVADRLPADWLVALGKLDTIR